MINADPKPRPADPRLENVPLDRLTAPPGTVLAHSLALYRQRLQTGTDDQFNACI